MATDPVRKLARRVRALLKRIRELEQELAVERALRAAQAPLWPTAPTPPVYPAEPWPGYPAPYVGDPPPVIITTTGSGVEWDDQRLSGSSFSLDSVAQPLQ